MNGPRPSDTEMEEFLTCPNCNEPFDTDTDACTKVGQSHVPISSAGNCSHSLCFKCVFSWKGKKDDHGWIACPHDGCEVKKAFSTCTMKTNPVTIKLAKVVEEMQQHQAQSSLMDSSADASGNVEEIEKPSLDEISYLLRCDICWEKFETDSSQYPTDEEKRTSHLPVLSHKCSHTMCCKCLVQFEKAEKPKSGWMPCKICNLKTAFRTSSMVLNSTLMSLIAFVDPSTFRPAVPCTDTESTENSGGISKLAFRPMTRHFHKKQAAAKENEINAAIEAGRLTPREDGRLTPREEPTSTTNASAAVSDGMEVEDAGGGTAAAASTKKPAADTKTSFEVSDPTLIAPGANVAAAAASDANSIRDGKNDDSCEKKPAAITTDKETVPPAAAAAAAASATAKASLGRNDTTIVAASDANSIRDGKDDDSCEKKPAAITTDKETVPPAAAAAASATAKASLGRNDTTIVDADSNAGTIASTKKPSGDALKPNEETISPALATAPINKDGVFVSGTRVADDIDLDVDDDGDGSKVKRPGDIKPPSAEDNGPPTPTTNQGKNITAPVANISAAKTTAGNAADSSTRASIIAEKSSAGIEKPSADFEKSSEPDISVQSSHRLVRLKHDLVELNEALSEEDYGTVGTYDNPSFIDFLQEYHPHVGAAFDALLKSLRMEDDIEADEHSPIDRLTIDLVELLELAIANDGGMDGGAESESVAANRSAENPDPISAQAFKPNAVHTASAPVTSFLGQANTVSAESSTGHHGSLLSVQQSSSCGKPMFFSGETEEIFSAGLDTKPISNFADQGQQGADTAMDYEVSSLPTTPPLANRGQDHCSFSTFDLAKEATFVILSRSIPKILTGLERKESIVATKLNRLEEVLWNSDLGAAILDLKARVKLPDQNDDELTFMKPPNQDELDELAFLEAKREEQLDPFKHELRRIRAEIATIKTYQNLGVKKEPAQKEPFTCGGNANKGSESSCSKVDSANVDHRPSGTSHVEYSITSKADRLAMVCLQSITAMEEYENSSFEELRNQDRDAGNRGKMKTLGSQFRPALGSSGTNNIPYGRSAKKSAHDIGFGFSDEEGHAPTAPRKVRVGFTPSDGPARPTTNTFKYPGPPLYGSKSSPVPPSASASIGHVKDTQDAASHSSVPPIRELTSANHGTAVAEEEMDDAI